MDVNRLDETEAVLARTDRALRSEMVRLYGPDGVLRFGYRCEGRGEDTVNGASLSFGPNTCCQALASGAGKRPY